MIYRKNLPAWERIARVAAGTLIAAYGLFGPGVEGNVGGFALVAAGAGAALTGFFGFCPACYLAGRRLQNMARKS